MRKIIIHPRHGLGWSTYFGYINYEIRKFALEYQPIINALEKEDEIHENHPAIIQFIKDMKEKFDIDVSYSASWGCLEIEEVNCAVKIKNYDGQEYIDKYSQDWV